MDLGESLDSVGKMNDDWVLIIDTSDHIGGRHKQVDVVKPNGCIGPKVMMGLGAVRYKNPTFQLQRRLHEETKIPSYCSPFRQHIFPRGRSALCETPSQYGCGIYTPSRMFIAGNVVEFYRAWYVKLPTDIFVTYL